MPGDIGGGKDVLRGSFLEAGCDRHVTANYLNMSGKGQAVKVVIRTRPTADFAQKNIDIDPAKGSIKMTFEKDANAGIINN